jgi:hypothetical protein
LNTEDIKMQNTVKYVAAVLIMFSLACFMTACTGNTGSGDAPENFGGTTFVSGDETGTITLSVNTGSTNRLAVADTATFSVSVKNADGGPVAQALISCETESGLALIEPTSGVAFTDGFGTISGRIGCATPGSKQMVCGIAGTTKRQFTTIVCTGEVPTGFDGFAGSGGGNLGGGVADFQDSNIRITALDFFDDGTAGSTNSIDTQQNICDIEVDEDDNETIILEPFFDTSVQVTVVNNLNSSVLFNSLRYSVQNATGPGTATFNSGNIALTGEGLSLGANGEEDTITSLIFDVVGGSKHFVGSQGATQAIPANLGFRTVTVTLLGTTALGESVQVSGSTTLSFDDFNRCD